MAEGTSSHRLGSTCRQLGPADGPTRFPRGVGVAATAAAAPGRSSLLLHAFPLRAPFSAFVTPSSRCSLSSSTSVAALLLTHLRVGLLVAVPRLLAAAPHCGHGRLLRWPHGPAACHGVRSLCNSCWCSAHPHPRISSPTSSSTVPPLSSSRSSLNHRRPDGRLSLTMLRVLVPRTTVRHVRWCRHHS